jgi:hypothetical protein
MNFYQVSLEAQRERREGIEQIMSALFVSDVKQNQDVSKNTLSLFADKRKKTHIRSKTGHVQSNNRHIQSNNRHIQSNNRHIQSYRTHPVQQ